MKVLFVNPGGQAQGGAERSLAALIGGMSERGHEPLVALLARGDAATAFTTAGAVVVGVLADELRVAPRHGSTAQFVRGAVSAAPAVLRIGMDLRRLATRHGIDVIHSNGYRSHLLSPILAPGGPPIVWSLRDRAPRSLHQRLLRASSLGVGPIVANSKFTAEQFSDSRTPVHVIANPVAKPEATGGGGPIMQAAIPANRHVVAVIAHLDHSKGHDLMLEALALWPEAERPFLVIAGRHLYGQSGDYLAWLRQRVSVLGLADDVTFAGNVDDISMVYDAADVVVHPCRHPEGFGRVIVEAQLAGVPVVATALGGVRELIRHDENGLLVPSEDPSALQGAIDRAMWPGAHRKRLIAGGLVAGARFGVDKHVEAMIRVYDSVLGNTTEFSDAMPSEVTATGSVASGVR